MRAIVTRQARKRNSIAEAWKEIAVLFAAAFVIDLIYTLMVFL